jgi:hypothetical protein
VSIWTSAVNSCTLPFSRTYAYVRLARHRLSRAGQDLVSLLPRTP